MSPLILVVAEKEGNVFQYPFTTKKHTYQEIMHYLLKELIILKQEWVKIKYTSIEPETFPNSNFIHTYPLCKRNCQDVFIRKCCLLKEA